MSTAFYRCQVDVTDIDDTDDVDDDKQIALVWCKTHRKYEWHWLDREIAPIGYSARRRAKWRFVQVQRLLRKPCF